MNPLANTQPLALVHPMLRMPQFPSRNPWHRERYRSKHHKARSLRANARIKKRKAK